MFKNKTKAVTFSFDDGVGQDIRLIEIFNKYNLKATFNINSGLFGMAGSLVREDVLIPFNRIKKEDIKSVYEGHEVAVHTLTHPYLPDLEESKIIQEVEEDRLCLSNVCGYEVVGMAYPCRSTERDDRVVNILSQKTGVKYSRTTKSTYNFNVQTDLLHFNPTVHQHADFDKMMHLAEEFINLKTTEPKVFYIWGHSFEFDIRNKWDRFEDFCKLISGHDDIFYGTNKEVML